MYRLSDKYFPFDDEGARSVSKWAKDAAVLMRSQLFDSLDPILVLSFLSLYKMSHVRNGVYERADLWPLHFFIKYFKAAARNTRSALK